MTTVHAWHTRVLHDLSPSAAVPRLGSPSWVALLDSDPLKLAAAIPPAVAYLTENTPAAITARLRRELATIDHAVIQRIRTASWDLSGAQDWRHATNSPSHAELVRRRLLTICVNCATRYAWTATRCPDCGWGGTPEEIRAAATRSWGYILHRGQGAA
jgi:ribosomal protein L40E